MTSPKAPILIKDGTEPTYYRDLTAGDTITFGSLTSKWVIREHHGYWLKVDCIEHRDPQLIGHTKSLQQGATAVWLIN